MTGYTSMWLLFWPKALSSPLAESASGLVFWVLTMGLSPAPPPRCLQQPGKHFAGYSNPAGICDRGCVPKPILCVSNSEPPGKEVLPGDKEGSCRKLSASAGPTGRDGTTWPGHLPFCVSSLSSWPAFQADLGLLLAMEMNS